MIAYTAILTTFTGAMAATTPYTEGMALAFTLLASLQAGTLGNASLSLTPLCLDEKDIGIALGLVGTSRAVFSAIGQAVFVAVLNSGLRTNIPKYVVPAAIQAGLPTSDALALLQGLAEGNLTAVPDTTPRIIAAAVAANKEAYSQSFKMVFLSSIAFGVCALVSALLIPNLEEKFTGVVARKLRGKHEDIILESKETKEMKHTRLP